MALQENTSEINISSAPMKKLLHGLRYLFVNSKTVPFIGALIMSYTYIEISVLSILMEYLTASITEVGYMWIGAIVTNIQDGLSSLFFVPVSLISEAYMGCFTMITVCAAASIQGLMLLWASTALLNETYAVAIFLLAIGKSGQKLSQNFLHYQLLKVKRQSVQENKSTQHENEQDLVETVLTTVLLFAPLVVGYIIAEFTSSFTARSSYEELFCFAALLMGGTLMLFLFGSKLFSHEELPDESNLHKIFRICKSAFGKLRSKYPTSVNGYYCKEYKQNHFYDNGKRLRLTPRVPRLFRWLDKAAIVEPEDSKDLNEMNLEMLKKNGKLCTVKEVREVKSLVPMIYMCFSFFAYSVLVATGNTFFVAQTIKMKKTGGNDISRLFLIKAVVRNISQFICFSIEFIVCNTEGTHFMSNRKVATIVRIGFGMVCAVVCSFVAWKVEAYRLSLLSPNQGNVNKEIGKTSSLVPQFILLGMTEGLVEGGLESLFCGHVVKSMWGFKDSFTELVIGTGKLFIIPLVLIFRRWIRVTANNSHLDRFYLMLGILNVVFLMVFAYYSFTYAYKEVGHEDDEVTTVERLENANPIDSMDSNQENDNEAHSGDQEKLLRSTKKKMKKTMTM